LSAGYYTTLTNDYYYGQSSTASNANLLASSNLTKAFKFTIDGSCPTGTDIPFTVTFTDSWGNTWTDTLTIPVVATGASIAINTPAADNYKISEAANGNADGKANPHETHNLDIRIKNGGSSKVLGLQAALSTSNTYVTIDQGTATIGALSAGYYTTLTNDYYYGQSSTTSNANLLASSNLTKAFKFTIDGSCPTGTDIPFTVTFTDSWGNTWTDTFTIPVVSSIGITTPVANNYKIIEAANGNDDGKANPHETHYLDIRIKNARSNRAVGLQVALSTTNSYVTIDQGTATIGDLDSGYYKTLTDSVSSSSSNTTLLVSANLNMAFKFTIKGTCPAGTQLPFTITFTETGGNTWTDTLTISVVAPGASIAINTPVANNYRIREAENGNDDGKANPHETHYCDIRIKNGGTSKVIGLQAALTTSSGYVTIDQGTATIGNVSAGYYTTLTDSSAKSTASSATLLYSSNLAQAFRFTINNTCPPGTQLPFTVTFTDSWGNTWTDTLTVPVE
jgi:hypothetical protein